MTFEEIQDKLVEENPEALYADGFEGALVGFARRCGQPTLAAYDYGKAVEILQTRDGMTEEEAVEYLEFNTLGAWVGVNTPIWICR